MLVCRLHEAHHFTVWRVGRLHGDVLGRLHVKHSEQDQTRLCREQAQSQRHYQRKQHHDGLQSARVENAVYRIDGDSYDDGGEQ